MGATPKMNRSAKDGARSSLHYGGEGVPAHPLYQGVCGRHGREDNCVTQGDLVASELSTPQMGRCIKDSQGTGSCGGYFMQTTQQFSKASYKETPKSMPKRCEESENRIVLKLANNRNVRTIQEG